MKRAPDPVHSFEHVASIMTAAIEASGYWPKAEVGPAVERFLRADGRDGYRPFANLSIGASRVGDDQFEPVTTTSRTLPVASALANTAIQPIDRAMLKHPEVELTLGDDTRIV